MPTAFNTSREREAPIKNKVIVSVFLARLLIPSPIIIPDSDEFNTYVLNTIARIKKKINQGILIFCPLLLNIKEVANAIGMIQRARVNLIVVATFSASSP